MAYLFNTAEDRQAMLQEIGVASVDELFDGIPANLRMNRPLDTPPAMSEWELESWMHTLAGRTSGASTRTCFQGGGAYDHFVPAAVDAVAGRSEFYTAYTPYQAEASQGSLQTFFEFQSLICQLSGMDVSNASLYEGGSSVTEAVLMAMRVTNRTGRVVVLGSLHPEHRQILETYLTPLGTELVTVETPDGFADPGRVEAALDDKTACLVIQHPNFFGALESPEELVPLCRRVGALAVVSYDPVSVGLLKRPGDYEADIAVAEGQALGIPLQYGGPYLGLLSCREEYVRKMPGRLIGQTVDKEGRTCFVLNLQAREQHIRRAKATSNICTNQGLMAIRATAYVSLTGPQGLKELAELCLRKAHYAAEQLCTLPGVSLKYQRPFFKEFTLQIEQGAKSFCDKARAAGFDLGPTFGQFDGWTDKNAVIVAVTEKRTRQEIDALVAALK